MAGSPKARVNYWPDSQCARAFWHQQNLAPYQELLRDTSAWLDPKPNERWLDLGCGCGRLTRAVWHASGGRVGQVIGSDCAAANAEAYAALRRELGLPADSERVLFQTADFSSGLAQWESGSFDGVVSGLAIQYAESFDEETGQWTTAGYDRLLSEVYRVLRPGGRFVFSVNVPNPAWWKVSLASLRETFAQSNPLKYLQRSYHIWIYGGWLRREARRGRFHYLPKGLILEKLSGAGFAGCQDRSSFTGQAFVFRCEKPALASTAAA